MPVYQLFTFAVFNNTESTNSVFLGDRIKIENIWSMPFWKYLNTCRGIETGQLKQLNFEKLCSKFDKKTIDLHTELPCTDQQTCWHDLCEVGDAEMVRYFLSSLEDPFVFSRSLFTRSYCALHFACRGGNREIVQFLLDSGFDRYLNERDGRRGYKTPLFVACQKLHVGVVELLLNNGADSSVLNLHDKTVQKSMKEMLFCYNKKLQEYEDFSEEYIELIVSIEKIERIQELLSDADNSR